MDIIIEEHVVRNLLQVREAFMAHRVVSRPRTVDLSYRLTISSFTRSFTMSPRTPTSRTSSFHATVQPLFATPVKLPSPDEDKPLLCIRAISTPMLCEYISHLFEALMRLMICIQLSDSLDHPFDGDKSVDACDVVLESRSHPPSSSRALDLQRF